MNSRTPTSELDSDVCRTAINGSSRLVRRASRALRLVSRRPRSRRLSARALAFAALRLAKRWQHRVPGLPTALPPAAPPSFVRGTCGGISIQWAGKLAHRFGC